MTRAERRKRTWRYIQRQKEMYKNFMGITVDSPHYFHKKSCWCCGCAQCGNPRKYRGEKTFQENKIDIDKVDALIEEHFSTITDEEFAANLREANFSHEEIEETIKHMVSILEEIYPDGIPDEEMDKLKHEGT